MWPLLFGLISWELKLNSVVFTLSFTNVPEGCSLASSVLSLSSVSVAVFVTASLVFDSSLLISLSVCVFSTGSSLVDSVLSSTLSVTGVS